MLPQLQQTSQFCFIGVEPNVQLPHFAIIVYLYGYSVFTIYVSEYMMYKYTITEI